MNEKNTKEREKKRFKRLVFFFLSFFFLICAFFYSFFVFFFRAFGFCGRWLPKKEFNGERERVGRVFACETKLFIYFPKAKKKLTFLLLIFFFTRRREQSFCSPKQKRNR